MKVALVGSKGSGKDFIADILVKEHNYTKVAFADSVKKYCSNLFENLDKYDSHETKDKVVPEDWNVLNETPRDIWNRVSGEVLEDDPELFLRITVNDINNLLENTENVIVTDTRNDYEYNKLVDMGFLVVYITKPDGPVFIGYDERIKKFYKNISLHYSNCTDGTDFITYIQKESE